jgi:hypothetical protein
VPAVAVNVTGPMAISVRALGTALGQRLGKTPTFVGAEASDALLSDARALQSRLGDQLPSMPLDQLMDWTAEWVRESRPLLGKATKYEVRDGRF